MHLLSQTIQWCPYWMVIQTFHKVIKVSHDPEYLSRLKDKCYTQITMMPSSSNWIFSFTVLPKGNTGSPLSRDLKRHFQNNLPIVNSPSIHLGHHIHSIQSGFIKACILNHRQWEDHSILFNSHLARYTFHQTINTASRIQYRSASSLKESSSQLFTYPSLP
ncbi:hypothetical protein O181_013620 [Austropuccinia psidii MF-1]|uniref:Uncharacterized protein n=1 Tax=Austropuccinia psidii MF-1 TaxID=1389203 RepID=A0A9Q3GP39_9BASI|nr:hypothetical protein [Austropuccinia psidii MF-1]